MPNLVSQLTLRLVDDVSGKSKTAAGGLDKLGLALKDAATNAKALGGAANFTGRFINSISKLGLSAREIERVSSAMREFQRLNNIGGDPAKWTRQHLSAIRAWESQTVGALRRVARAQVEAGGGGGRSGRPGMGAVAGMGLGYAASHASMAAAVLGPGYLVHKGIAARAKFGHERVRAEVSGMTPGEISEAIQEAGKLQNDNKAFDIATILHLLRNTRSVVGSYSEAAHVADPLLKLRTVALGSNPERKEELEADFDKLVKGMEIKGVTQDMPRFKHYIDNMAKAMNVFGDTLRPTDYYEMFKYGRQSTQSLSDDYMLKVAPTLAQELGGSSAGTANSAFYRAIVGGKMSNLATQELNGLGLLDPKKVVKTKTGSVKGVKAGGIMGSDVAARDPYEWVQQFLLPALNKKGITDPEKQQERIARVFSNTVAAQLVGIFATQQSRILKDKGLIGGAKGISAAHDFATKDPYIAWENLKASAASLAEASGGLGSAVKALNSVAEVMSNLAKRYLEIDTGHDNKEMITPEGVDRLNDILGGPPGQTILKRTNPGMANAVQQKLMRDQLSGLDTSIADTEERLKTADESPMARLFGYNRIKLQAQLEQLRSLKAEADSILQGLSDAVLASGIANRQVDTFNGLGIKNPGAPGAINPVGAFGFGKGGVGVKAPLDEILEKAGEAKKKLGSLEEAVTPQINTASIDSAITKGQQLKTLLASLGALADGAATSAARATSFVDT